MCDDSRTAADGAALTAPRLAEGPAVDPALIGGFHLSRSRYQLAAA